MMLRSIFLVLIPMVLIGVVEVYNVDPYQNYNAKVDGAVGVRQTFIATSDSITRLEFFVGYSPGQGQYYLAITEIAGAEVTVPAPDPGWQWIGGNLQTPAKVTKGKTYTLKITHSTDSVNYYYDPTNPYEY